MNITIQKAKNGEETVSVDGHFLHSNYAPVKEAERFVENLTLPFIPEVLIISEPGLSYTADFLRKKFPGIKIGVIRFTPSFAEYNKYFDFVLNYFEHPNFESYLENVFNEEQLLTTHFISWPASSQIFKQEDSAVWNAVKAAMLRAKTLLITRQYFEKKWFLNSCNFLKQISTSISFEGKSDKPVLIISSGPSLIPFIKPIKENRDKFFILALSSAISVCIKYQITPDLFMTTDGGYWAGQHLKKLKGTSVPVAMPAEAYCSKALLTKLKVLPLDYGDGISSELVKAAGLKTKKAVRNGTVSGTALLFAAEYFTKDIYLCGMDMAGQTGFQHTQPNELEINAAIKDNRINTKFLRLTKSELTNGSLDIYKDWFINNPLKINERKVYRLIEKNQAKNSLGWIKDIPVQDFEKLICKEDEETSINFSEEKTSIPSQKIKELFDDDKNSEIWKKQLFPLDYVQLSHNPSNTEIKNKIDAEWDELKKRAERILV